MKKFLLPIGVGFCISMVGLVCLQQGLGLQFVVFCIPTMTTLLIMLAVQIIDTQNKLLEVAQAISRDFANIKEYVDDEFHEVYMTIANDRFDSN